MDRLLRALLAVNLEAKRMVEDSLEDTYEEFNDETSDDPDDYSVVAQRSATQFSDLVEEYEEDDDLIDLVMSRTGPRWERLCNWGVPHYIWDATKVHLAANDALTEDTLEETVFVWTAMMRAGEVQAPLRYAVCGADNLQSCILGSVLDEDSEEPMTLLQIALEGRLPKQSGLCLLKKRYLHLDWRALGHALLDITDKATLNRFVKEREDACSVGPCVVLLAKDVDKRYKRGIVLDLAVFQ